jgi:hypothetical protein
MMRNVDDGSEPFEGAVSDPSPRSEAHRYAVAKLNRALCRGLGPGYSVRIRDAVAVPGWLGARPPEVDIAVLVDKFYRPLPTAADALVFIEVVDGTYEEVRHHKIPLYVAAGVPSWIVHVGLRRVESYHSKADLKLQHGNVFSEHDTIELLGLSIPVGYLFDVIVRP